MAGEREEGAKVRALIERATNTMASEVDPRLLKAIKSVVRYSDSELRVAVQTLMDLMKRDHSQVRYVALLIIDELFMRSKLFRTLVVENLDQILTLSVGFRKNLPLPAPPAVASALRSKAIEFLEKWNTSFGIHYRQLRLGFDYLKNTLRFQFPNLQANAARLQQERNERERRSKEILKKKFEMLMENLSSIKEEIQSTIEEIEECLEIVHTREDSVPFDPSDDEISEEFWSSELRQIRLDALKEGEKVHENSENEVVFDTLRELNKLVVTKHLGCVQEWISVLVRVEAVDNWSRDSTLKEFINIKNRLHSVKKKCEESGCNLHKTDNPGDKDEDFWEEGKIEPIQWERSSTPKTENEGLGVASTSHAVKNSRTELRNKKSDGNEMLGSESRRTDPDLLKSELLSEAPEMKRGSFLDIWGSNPILANQRGLDLESHWGRVDFDAVIPAEKIAELGGHILYKEEPKEIPPCRAPLRNGGLCQRRDLRVCPFHGAIIPRDDEGNPLNQSPLIDESAPDLVEKLATQAVKNVRERDKEAAKKREIDKKMLKRAKHAKVREHNDSVLRDAAMASTSSSAAFGEDMEDSGGETRLAKNKTQTLASMLRKKVTPKDRIAQRLLNTRSRGR